MALLHLFFTYIMLWNFKELCVEDSYEDANIHKVMGHLFSSIACMGMILFLNY